MVNNINQAAININRARIWIQRFYGLSDNEKRHLMANYSIPLDRHGLHDLRSDEAITQKVFRLIMISSIGVESIVVAAEFATDFEKFRTRPSANYDISGRPFSSLDDGTYRTGAPVTPTNPNGLLPADPRLAKVKTFLRRYLTREPTDKDIDWFVYTYFGSDAFGLGDMFYGMQDSYYNARGRKIRRNVPYDEPVRRNQRRILSGVGYNRRTYRYHGRFNNNNNSNSNSNNRHRNAVAYLQNKPAVKRNQNRNKSNNAKKIQWKENTVNNMPDDFIAGHNFSNGQKAVKYTWREGGGNFSQYMEPNTFRTQSRMSMTDAYNKPGSFSMFKNPFTRNGRDVKRANISFVILKNKNQGRATKLKTQAAKKIQTARRKQVKKRVSARRTLLANAASKRKRSPK
jgi:hypothetical protein